MLKPIVQIIDKKNIYTTLNTLYGRDSSGNIVRREGSLSGGAGIEVITALQNQVNTLTGEVASLKLVSGIMMQILIEDGRFMLDMYDLGQYDYMVYV